MSGKTLLLLLIIFCALGLAASASLWTPYLSLGKAKTVSSELDFSVFTTDNTDQISISKKGEEEKILTKEGGGWKINGLDAAARETEEFFTELTAAKIESLVSKNPENYKNFAVDEENATTLTFIQGDKTTTFIIGGRGTVFASFHAKTKESNNIYLVSGSLLNKLSQNINAWRDKIIVDLPGNAIQKIEIVSGRNKLVLEKQENVWQANWSEKTAVPKEIVINKLLAALNPLEASDFLDEKEKKEFERQGEKNSLVVLGEDKKILAELRLLEKETEWWAAAKGKDIFYKIPAYKMADIMLKPEGIFK